MRPDLVSAGNDTFVAPSDVRVAPLLLEFRADLPACRAEIGITRPVYVDAHVHSVHTDTRSAHVRSGTICGSSPSSSPYPRVVLNCFAGSRRLLDVGCTNQGRYRTFGAGGIELEVLGGNPRIFSIGLRPGVLGPREVAAEQGGRRPARLAHPEMKRACQVFRLPLCRLIRFSAFMRNLLGLFFKDLSSFALLERSSPEDDDFEVNGLARLSNFEMKHVEFESVARSHVLPPRRRDGPFALLCGRFPRSAEWCGRVVTQIGQS